MSVEMYASGDSVVAGLVPATSRRCCGRVSICEISVSADVWEKCHTKGWWPAPGRPLHCYQGCIPPQTLSAAPKNLRNMRENIVAGAHICEICGICVK